MKELGFDKLYVKFSNLYCEYRSRKQFLKWLKSAKNLSEELFEVTPSEGGSFDVVLSFEEIKDVFPIMENSLPKYENDIKQVLLAIKEMGQLEVAKIWHEDDWGDGFVNTETEHTYNYKGKFTVKTLRKVRDYYSTSPETFSKHKIIEVKHVSTLPYNIEGLFANCYNLEKICTIDFKSVYNARGLFSRCTSLKSIPDDFKFNFTSYTKEQWEDEEFKDNYIESFEIDNMFYETGIENVPDGIFSSIQGEDFYGYITCNSMFYNTPIKEFNIQLPYRIGDCSYMFKNCTQLASIRSLWNDQYEYGIYLGKDSNYMGCLVSYTFENCTGIITIDGQPGTLDDVPNIWKDTYSNN